MKKTIILSIVIAMMMSFCTIVSAETSITVEGEEYTTVSDSVEFKISSWITAASGGKHLQVWNQKNQKYSVTYNVAVEKAGTYILDLYATDPHKPTYASPYVFMVNGYEYEVALADGSHVSSDIRHLLGKVRLKAGINTIKFEFSTPRSADGSIVFMVDRFEFSDGGSRISSVVPVNGVLNVFERNNNVSFKINALTESTKSRTYDFVVKNYWGKTIIEDKFKIIQGKDSFLLNLGNLDLGWYQLTISDKEETYYNDGFSVVHNYSERKTYENTPFGFDFASTYFVPDPEMKRAYAKVAKLAGGNWVRERLKWNYDAATDSVDDLLKSLEPIKEEGLNILPVFDGTGLSLGSGNNITGMPKSLYEVYSFGKKNAEKAQKIVDAFEMLNEADGGFWKASADDAAAFMKAALIGVDDSGTEAMKLFGGFSVSPKDGLKTSQIAAEHLFMNDIVRYSDAINFHEYSFDNYMINGNSLTRRGNEMKNAANAYWTGNNKIVWCSETALTAVNGLPDSQEIMGQQARGGVTVPVKHLANGTRMINYFILPKYMEGEASFGIFADGYPYPVYSTYSNLTYQLGKAEYKGKLANLPEGARGELFNNGEEDVAVLWGDRVSSMNLPNVENAVMVDMFGVETKLEDNPTITFSNYPIFVRFDGLADDKLFFPTELSDSYTTNKFVQTRHYLPNEKIVLRQVYDGTYDSSVKNYGHLCDLENGNRVTLEVYNFNNSEQNVNISAEIGPGLEVYPKNVEVNVAPMEQKSIDFTVKMENKNEIKDEYAFLKFSGDTNDGEISHSVSKINLGSEKSYVEPEILLEKPSKAANWDLKDNATVGTVINTANENGGVTFSISKWGEGDKWFYPYFEITDEERVQLSGKDGMCFEAYLPEFVNAFRGHVFFLTADGRKYWVSEEHPYLKGWNQYTVELDRVKLFSSPMGALDPRPFDFSEIVKMSIGCNSAGKTSPPYTIRNVGFYTKSDEDVNIFSIKGIPENRVVKAGENVSVTITVADDMDMSTFRMMLNEKECTDFTLNGNEVTINLNNIKRGDYLLFVACEKTYIDDIKRQTVAFRAE